MADDKAGLGGAAPHVADQLLEAGWSDLGAIEHPVTGHLLFPSEIYRRSVKGPFERTKVMLRVPRQPDVRAARRQARDLAADEGMDPERDKDLILELENTCMLAQSIRNSTLPYEPMEPDPLDLEKHWDKPSLNQAWAKLDILWHVIDPAPGTISEQEMVVVLAKLVKERNLGPLAVYAPAAQAYFVIYMAEQLMTLLAARLSLVSSDSSTPA